MPTLITTPTKVSDINQNQLVISMEEVAAQLDPNAGLVDMLLTKIGGVRAVGRMEHKWRERRIIGMTTTVTANAAAAATSVAVAKPSLGFRDMQVYCPRTGSAFRMNEDIGGTDTSGSIKVIGKNGTGGIPHALVAGDVLVFGLEAHAEGEDIPPAFATQEDDASTYLQQFDETIQVTDIANSEETYGEKELALQRRQKYTELRKRFCLNLYLGQKFRETTTGTNSARRHGMAGLVEYLTPTAIDASTIPGGITMRTLGEFIRPTTSHSASSMRKLLIAGQNLYNTINAFPEAVVRTTPGEQSKWGVTVKTLHTGYGEIDVFHDRLLSQEYGMAGHAFIIDPNPEYLHLVELNGRPWQVLTNIQNSTDIHNIKDATTGTRGLVLKLPELHQMVTGIN